MLDRLKYFSLDEFDSPDHPNSGVNMDPNFLKLLDLARGIAQTEFRVTSGYRTESHNKNVGGVPNSSHLRGFAADIAAVDSLSRYKIVSAALQAGINRIGIANTFIHLDADPDKSPNVIWTY